MPIIRSSRLHVCYCRLWCAVLGCWLSEVRSRAAGCASRKGDIARRSRAILKESVWCLFLHKPFTICDAPPLFAKAGIQGQKRHKPTEAYVENIFGIKYSRQLGACVIQNRNCTTKFCSYGPLQQIFEFR